MENIPDSAVFAETKQFLLDKLEVGDNRLVATVADTLHGADDGELFLGASSGEHVLFEQSRVKSAGYSEDEGFGMRRVVDESVAFAFGNDLSFSRLTKAAQSVCEAVKGESSQIQQGPEFRQESFYPASSPLTLSLRERVALLRDIDSYIRAKDARVREVNISLMGKVDWVLIVRGDGLIVPDVRPLVRLGITVFLEENGKMETGNDGFGGREDYTRLFQPDEWRTAADTALARADDLLNAKECPAGEMPVVVGPGWGGVLLHEAIGHGMEGDFIRRKASPFAELLGTQVASEAITIVDDATLPGCRGSLSVDDEGTPTERTILVENGTVVSFMHDRLSARKLRAKPTGNSRRESFAHSPMVRMTNTFMCAGPHAPEEIIGATKRGVFLDHFTGGQVELGAGSFVFTASPAYLIEDGKITAPLKSVTITGAGYDVLTHVDMVAADTALDPGIGTCGKDGQGVPVGVGQPTLRVASGGMIVGGTDV